MTGSDHPAFECLLRQLAHPLEPEIMADAYDRLYTGIIRARLRTAASDAASALPSRPEQQTDLMLAA